MSVSFSSFYSQLSYYEERENQEIQTSSLRYGLPGLAKHNLKLLKVNIAQCQVNYNILGSLEE